MILMALLPRGEDRPVSHLGSYPATRDLWATVLVAIGPRLGEFVVDGRYQIAAIDDAGIKLTRVETGSFVKATRKKVEHTYSRLLAGEEIQHRRIDYTVAIEFGVLLALGNLVEDDGKVYRLAKRGI